MWLIKFCKPKQIVHGIPHIYQCRENEQKGKYHCLTDLFILFEFSCFTCLVKSKLVKQEASHIGMPPLFSDKCIQVGLLSKEISNFGLKFYICMLLT